MDAIPWAVLVAAVLVILAMQKLTSLSLQLRERLQKLLVEYVKVQREEGARKRKILEIRERVKRLKEAAKRQAELTKIAQDNEVRERAEKVKARVVADQAKRDLEKKQKAA